VPYLGLNSGLSPTFKVPRLRPVPFWMLRSAMYEVLACRVLKRMTGDGGGERNRVMEQEVVDWRKFSKVSHLESIYNMFWNVNVLLFAYYIRPLRG
jgi:hypothetical protein